MNQKPSETDDEDKIKKSKSNFDNNANSPAQYSSMNMFFPPPGFAMAPPGYPYYPPTAW